MATDTRARRTARWAFEHVMPMTFLRIAAARGDLQARVVTASLANDADTLAAHLEQARRRGGIVPGRFATLATSHAAVKQSLTSPDVRVGFPRHESGRTPGRRAALAQWAAAGHLHPLKAPSLLAVEPPDHTRYRKLLTRVFTVRAVEALRPRIETIAAGLLDELQARGADDPTAVVDLVEDYCARLPVIVIAEILGVPPEQHAKVLRMGSAAAPSLDMGLPWSEFTAVEDALAEFDEWIDGHLAHLRAHPDDTLMSQLLRASDEEGILDERELRATAGLVLAAGFETTVNLLGNGIALLHDHPDQLAVLRERPDLWPNAVEEVLRVDPPVHLTGRTVTRDTQVAGVALTENSMLTAMIGAANRDPDVFTDPERFDVARPNARDHLAFSAGRHHCLGAALARLEGEIGLRAIHERFPDLALLPGRVRRTTRVLRGHEHLPARLGQSTSRVSASRASGR